MSKHILNPKYSHNSQYQLRSFGNPNKLLESELADFEHIIDKQIILQRGDALIEYGSEFEFIYVVNSGSLKTIYFSPDGTEKVCDFLFSSDIAGLNAVGSSTNPSSVIALERTVVCQIKFSKLEKLMLLNKRFHRKILAIMSNEIQKKQLTITLQPFRSAISKTALFLLNLNNRVIEGSDPNSFFETTMTRADIGSYMGMTTETTSRQFSELAKRKLIKVNGKNIKVLNRQQLFEVAHQAL